MDERAMQELIHIGFLSADDKPDYDGHFDDEVAARLRYLQDELRKQSIIKQHSLRKQWRHLKQ